MAFNVSTNMAKQQDAGDGTSIYCSSADVWENDNAQ